MGRVVLLFLCLPVLLVGPAIPAHAQSENGRCNIKGNINSKKAKLYHMPGDNNYGRVNINTSTGERWFCSETDARAAGWQRAGTTSGRCKRDALDAVPSTDGPKEGCHIKGNTSRIYHVPGGRCYSETIIRKENYPRVRTH